MKVSISRGNEKLGSIQSVSLPSGLTCRECDCSRKCYARRIERRRPSVAAAYRNNLQVLETEPATYWREVEAAIMLSRFFRFHVSGDIPNTTYFHIMMEVAKRNSHCEILCFTKKYEIVNEVLASGIPLPSNLHKLYKFNPKLVVIGASAYSRALYFDTFRNVIDCYKKQTGNECYMLVDMAHIAGLVAAGDHPSPFGIADIITTTTHKTLRGTRGGLIFCKPELAKRIDSAVFPCCQGGALQHIIAGKAVTAEEACTDKFKNYIHAVVRNCKVMCDAFISMGYKVVTGGTDNHLFLLDLTETGLTGKAVQDELDRHGITLNKNCVPNETRSPQQTSGVRIGTAAMTTKGYTAEDFVSVAHTIDAIIKSMQEELHD